MRKHIGWHVLLPSILVLVVLAFSSCQTLPTRVIRTAEEVMDQMEFGNKFVLMNDEEVLAVYEGMKFYDIQDALRDATEEPIDIYIIPFILGLAVGFYAGVKGRKTA